MKFLSALLLFLFFSIQSQAGGYDVLNVTDPPYNAACNNIAYDDAPVSAAMVDGINTGKPVYVPGLCRMQYYPLRVDAALHRTEGFTIFGCGQRCGLNFIGATPIGPAGMPALWMYSTSTPGDWYWPRVHDLQILSDNPGPTLELGIASFVDPVNYPEFNNVTVLNVSPSAAAIACRLNYVAGGKFENFICNASPYNGVALELRQVAFTYFHGSFGNSSIGILLHDGFNYGNTFMTPDVENIHVGIRADSGTPWNNTFIGGRYDYTMNGFDFALGQSNWVINPTPQVPGTFCNRKVGLSIWSAYVPC